MQSLEHVGVPGPDAAREPLELEFVPAVEVREYLDRPEPGTRRNARPAGAGRATGNGARHVGAVLAAVRARLTRSRIRRRLASVGAYADGAVPVARGGEARLGDDLAGEKGMRLLHSGIEHRHDRPRSVEATGPRQ